MDDWGRLAKAVVARRVELGMNTRRALSESSGLSTRTLGDIERVRRDSYDAATLARVEQVLEWSPGTVDAILASEDPPNLTPDETEAAEVAAVEAEDLPESIRAQLVEYLRELHQRQRGEVEELRVRQAEERKRQMDFMLDTARQAAEQIQQSRTSREG